MYNRSLPQEIRLFTIEIDENTSTMVVLMHPSYLLDGLRFLLVILFGLPFNFAPKDLNNPSDFCVLNFIVIILLGFVFHSVYNKHSVNRVLCNQLRFKIEPFLFL